MKINRKRFFGTVRNNFGKLTQEKVNNYNFLLGKFETGLFKLPSQMGYMLATMKIETNDTFYPVVEGYWIKKNRLQVLYNYYANHNRGALRTIFPNVEKDSTGKIISFGLTYEGRGNVQCTHYDNYRKFGLEKTPDKALEPETAFMIMEKGMANGIFTGKTLQRYVNEGATDYYSARKVINGLDRASLIAGYAKQFRTGIELVSDEVAMQGYTEQDYIS